LKLTIQQFYRPSGDSTQSRGVVSDIELPSITSYLENISESDVDYALEFDRVDAVPFTAADLVDDDMLERLRRHSEDRRRDSSGFRQALRDIERYQEQRIRTTISLNEEEFLAERAAAYADREEPLEAIAEETRGDRPVFDLADYYNQEALAITLDYVDALRVARPGLATD
jgi:carboxyl-terminal processing protease